MTSVEGQSDRHRRTQLQKMETPGSRSARPAAGKDRRQRRIKTPDQEDRRQRRIASQKCKGKHLDTGTFRWWFVAIPADLQHLLRIGRAGPTGLQQVQRVVTKSIPDSPARSIGAGRCPPAEGGRGLTLSGAGRRAIAVYGIARFQTTDVPTPARGEGVKKWRSGLHTHYADSRTLVN